MDSDLMITLTMIQCASHLTPEERVGFVNTYLDIGDVDDFLKFHTT